jgi:hypothetical protein
VEGGLKTKLGHYEIKKKTTNKVVSMKITPCKTTLKKKKKKEKSPNLTVYG